MSTAPRVRRRARSRQPRQRRPRPPQWNLITSTRTRVSRSWGGRWSAPRARGFARERRTPLEMPDRSAPCFGEHPVARGARRGNNIIISSSVRPQPKIAKTNSAQKNRRRRPTAGGSSCLWVALLTDVAHVGAPLAHEDLARERRTPAAADDVVVAAASAASHGVLAKAWR